MDATQLRDRRMDQSLDEIVKKESDDFWRESQERRKAEAEQVERQAALVECSDSVIPSRSNTIH